MLSDSKTAGSIIDLREAVELTANYRAEKPNGIKAHMIDATLIRQVLEQEGCVAVRIYNGYDKAQSKVCPIIVGVSVDDKDMTEGIILEKMISNPPFGPNTSVLQE